MEEYYYFSLKYSAIQTAINRYDRLWSIAGISRLILYINEIKLSELAREISPDNSNILIAGGGKFTVKFSKEEDAVKFREEAIKLVSTTAPMLEFQASQILKGSQLGSINESFIEELNLKKNSLRGYAVTYNPHFLLCEECGEFPATVGKDIKICRICDAVKEESKSKRFLKDGNNTLTSIEKIYRKLFEKNINKKIPLEFEDLFNKSDEILENEDNNHNRIAVWFSDLNSMKDKVILWLNQEEDKLLDTFKKFNDFVINFISDALIETFKENLDNNKEEYFPFRIIVAGGDDLTIVMDEKYILPFAINLSKYFYNRLNNLEQDHPLSDSWLKHKKEELSNKEPKFKTWELKPLTFGASFIIAHYKMPFSRIYEHGEELLKKAKKLSNRKYNSIYWQIIIGENSEDLYLTFEKPLPITKNDAKKLDTGQWSLEEYIDFIEANKNTLTNSQIYQIVQAIINKKDIDIFKRNYCKETSNLYQTLINEKYFYNNNKLFINRILSLFEISRIK